MLLFEAYLKSGFCVRGEDWGLVTPHEVKALIVYHPWSEGLSCVIEGGRFEYFLYKEAVGTYGNQGLVCKIGFGRKKDGVIDTEIHFLPDGKIFHAIQGGERRDGA